MVALMVIGAVPLIGSAMLGTPHLKSYDPDFNPLLTVIAFPGIAALDEKQQAFEFRPLSQAQALGMGLSQEERQAYNDNLFEINVVADDLSYRVATQNLNFEEATKLYNKMTLEAAISPLAQITLTKIIQANTRTPEPSTKSEPLKMTHENLMLHSLGHNLGLRHNFAGSLSSD